MASVIAQATLADCQKLGVLFDEYRQFYGCASNVALAEQFINARLTEGSSLVFLACDRQGEALGFVQLYPSFSSLRLGPILILNDVFVTQHARCIGIGRQLVQRVIDYAAAQHIDYLKLETHRDNCRAQGFYQALGFVQDKDFVTYERVLGGVDSR
ncbi:MAG: GNAT family N-acetyltransferase [Shewanella sp.]